MAEVCWISLTSEWIYSDLFPLFQWFINILFLNTLNAQIGECCSHGFIVDFQCANAFAANIFAHELMWMCPVKFEKLTYRCIVKFIWDSVHHLQHDPSVLLFNCKKEIKLTDMVYPLWHKTRQRQHDRDSSPLECLDMFYCLALS